MNLNIQSTIKLNNGVEIPRLGLGVFRAKDGEETANAVRWALEAGYRHIDTAAVYGNEEGVGKGIRDGGVPREEIFSDHQAMERRDARRTPAQGV
jgi:diketogulonate reductase-like aldo/keto reductase